MGQDNFEQLGLFSKEIDPASPIDTDQLRLFQGGGGPQPLFFKTQTTQSDQLLGSKH